MKGSRVSLRHDIRPRGKRGESPARILLREREHVYDEALSIHRRRRLVLQIPRLCASVPRLGISFRISEIFSALRFQQLYMSQSYIIYTLR